ncbi:MAG: MoxR family ATPase [Phaeodactylibacter sp.]|uniref:AAA family ATPase n=1 Tax=Phaeodactylibacter sp. TaxID=1940289 RepID=UPI0032EBED39
MSFHLYGAKGQKALPPISLNERINDPALYLPAPGLASAVNVALNLGLPLLLTGEPGTGKTQLAYHIAHYFSLGKVLVFNAQTSSSAKDLFYRYDALGHFQHSQTQSEALSPEEIERRYIRFQALGAAIRSDQRRLVLIDEVDKAPRDLPNDILAALERLEFDVPEIDKSYATTKDNRPIIIMTSNSEKNLPEPFLRRVAYYHIDFPTAEELLYILERKVEGYEGDEGQARLQAIIDHFELIRSRTSVKLRKDPATAELIQWTALLHKLSFDMLKLADLHSLSEKAKTDLKLSYCVLAKNKDDLDQLHRMVDQA